MGTTHAFMLQPNEWTIIGQSKNVRMLQASEPKSMRVHFGDIREIPAVDTDDYILTQDYNPRPFDFDPQIAAYDEEVVFARPHGDKPMKVVAVMTSNHLSSFVPPPGRMHMTVNQAVSQPFVMSADYPTVTFSIASGSLPPGLVLGGAFRGALISGTPTQAGTFVFTVKAAWDEKPLTVGVIPAGSIEQTYVFIVGAAP